MGRLGRLPWLPPPPPLLLGVFGVTTGKCASVVRVGCLSFVGGEVLLLLLLWLLWLWLWLDCFLGTATNHGT